MCTATYFPRPHGGFVLTHSRDEKTLRPAALLPQPYERNGQVLLYPKDPQGSGTWIATSNRTTVCLLNGAFAAHQPQPPYQYSRGLVPLHVFDYDSIDEFLHDYDPRGLEPFTLLLAQMTGSPAGRLTELRWDGRRVFINDKNPDRPHIWSSATLYEPAVIETREGWFREWLHQNPQPTVGGIRLFHQTAGDGDPENSLCMNRQNALMTLSLTSVVHLGGTPLGGTPQDEAVTMLYDDFVSRQSRQLTLKQPDYATA